MILSCRQGNGGYPAEEKNDGFNIYLYGPYHFWTDGFSVDKSGLRGKFDFDEKNLEVSCLFKTSKEKKIKGLDMMEYKEKLSPHILEKGRLTKKQKAEIEKMSLYNQIRDRENEKSSIESLV